MWSYSVGSSTMTTRVAQDEIFTTMPDYSPCSKEGGGSLGVCLPFDLADGGARMTQRCVQNMCARHFTIRANVSITHSEWEGVQNARIQIGAQIICVWVLKPQIGNVV
jgi:hypothetical protein